MVPAIPSRVRPDLIRSFLGPKPRGGWRKFAILSDRDEFTWNGVAGRVAGILESRLDRGVVANRTIVTAVGWRLEEMRAARRRAGALVPRAGLLLRTDVEDFYPSITPRVLVRALADLGVPRRDSWLASRMLEGWGEWGHHGLPIGPVGSAVLANAVLARVDDALRSFHFIRWVDDYLIALPSEKALTHILDRLDSSLDGLHLRRSVPKTELLERGAAGIPWLPSRLHG